MKTFQQGYLFPEVASKEHRKEIAEYRRQDKRREQELRLYFDIEGFEEKYKAWKHTQTPLNVYTHPLRVDFEKILERKARIALQRGKTLRILDVGCGNATQWVKFLKLFPNVEWHGTTLTKTVKHHLVDKVRLCTAGNIHTKFEPESFDLIVSHLGFHDQPKEMLENTLHLLKPNGEAFLVNELEEIPFFEAQNHYKHFHILKENWMGTFWGAHFRKARTPITSRLIQSARKFLQDKGIIKTGKPKTIADGLIHL